MEQFGKYRIIRKLAGGGMGEIHLAEVEIAGYPRKIALKRILPSLTDNKDFLEMFVREARIIARLAHPNIVHILDFGNVGETFYQAMEYIPGHSLREVMERLANRRETVPPEVALHIARGVAHALAYAHDLCDEEGHALGLIHRDLNPRNILISDAGQVKVIDFGIARAHGITTQHTQHDVLKGIMSYIAPEYLENRPIDHRADLFSFGVVLYEMLAGVRPFHADSEAGVMRRILDGDFTSLTKRPNVPRALAEIVDRLLARDPDKRYQHFHEVIADINARCAEFLGTDAAHVAAWTKILFDSTAFAMSGDDGWVTSTFDFEQPEDSASHIMRGIRRSGQRRLAVLGSLLIASILVMIMSLWAPFMDKPPERDIRPVPPPKATPA
ncbi:serine/threonine protein kinase, partial [bacterium]|nr:serine/threonine protein kinase [bacterium]